MARPQRSPMHRDALEYLTLVCPDPVARGEAPGGIVGKTRQDLDVRTSSGKGPSDYPGRGGRARLGVVPLADQEHTKSHAATATRRSQELAH